jgi:hypothetical protein
MSSSKNDDRIYTSQPVQAVRPTDDVAGAATPAEPEVPASYAERGADPVARSVEAVAKEAAQRDREFAAKVAAGEPLLREPVRPGMSEPVRRGLDDLIDHLAADLRAKGASPASKRMAEDRFLAAASRLLGRIVRDFPEHGIGECAHVANGAPPVCAIAMLDVDQDGESATVLTSLCDACAAKVSRSVGRVLIEGLNANKQQPAVQAAEPEAEPDAREIMRRRINRMIVDHVWPKPDAPKGAARSLRLAFAAGLAALFADEVTVRAVGT